MSCREIASVEKKLQKSPGQIAQLEDKLMKHDPANYDGMVKLSEQLVAMKQKASELEERWLELTDQLDGE